MSSVRVGCDDLDPDWPDDNGRPRGPRLCVLYPHCECGQKDGAPLRENSEPEEIRASCEVPEGPHERASMHDGCLLCAWGSDLPDGEWCRACGFGKPDTSAQSRHESKLERAIKLARGGDAPSRRFRGYA